MGRTSYGLTGFDADGIPGWNAIALYDDVAESAWDLNGIMPRGLRL